MANALSNYLNHATPDASQLTVEDTLCAMRGSASPASYEIRKVINETTGFLQTS